MAFKVRPIAPISAILLSALSGVVFLLVFRWGVNHFIRKLPTPFYDYLQHGVMGALVVTLAVLAFSVAPAKMEGLGLVVQPLDYIGGWLVGFSFTTLSQSFIAMFAPPGSNPVPPLVSGDSPAPPSG
jgi:hypothetical protein